jgi:hypothetical protein
MTEEQRVVLEAAIDLVNGNLDKDKRISCYAIISNYVLQNSPKTKDQ